LEGWKKFFQKGFFRNLEDLRPGPKEPGFPLPFFPTDFWTITSLIIWGGPIPKEGELRGKEGLRQGGWCFPKGRGLGLEGELRGVWKVTLLKGLLGPELP